MRARVTAVPSALLALAVAALALAAPASTLSAQEGAPAGEGDLGVVSFPVSCAAEVQDDFDRAVALLHHMMYEQSRALFEGIAAADPGCAMARWGVATTLYQPLWPERPEPEAIERGHRLVAEALELGEVTERERGFLEAAAAFYDAPAEGGWWPRIRRWAAAMDRLREAHPDDREVRAFWALSQLALAYVADDADAVREAAAQELRALWEEEPRHPGAVHYTIHANDVAGRAGEAPEIVGSYADIAPSVPHALHMPTHIFVRTGAWPEVIEWNRRSADAALEHEVEGATSYHHVHAADYLVYAHLQRGEDDAARAVFGEVRRAAPYPPGFQAAYHLAALEARLVVERRDWEAAASLEPRAAADLDWDRFPWPEGITWFARGLGAVRTGDLAAARKAEARLAELRDRARAMDEAGFAAYLEVDRRILAAELAQSDGRLDEAVGLLEEAIALDARTPKHPVSPGALLPPAEAQGEMLLELDRPDAALAAFRASLERWPGRYRSTLGAARAAEASGAHEEAGRHYRALVAIAGESTRPGVSEARGYLGS